MKFKILLLNLLQDEYYCAVQFSLERNLTCYPAAFSQTLGLARGLGFPNVLATELSPD